MSEVSLRPAPEVLPPRPAKDSANNELETVYVHPPLDVDCTSPKPLDQLVHEIAAILGSDKYNAKDSEHVEKVRQLMESYDASGNEWKRFEFWDPEKNYTRNLIATDNRTFTLMLLCWNPKRASPIHAHEGSNCWMRMIDGSCTETRYAWPDPNQPMQPLCKGDLSAPHCAFICDKIGLHMVENSNEKSGAVSLHLYSPPFESCKVFLNPRCAQSSDARVIFHSEHGHKIDYHNAK